MIHDECYDLINQYVITPRIIINDCNYSCILDTNETTYNTLNNYLTNKIYKTNPMHRLFLESIYALLYGYYGGTKFSYLIQKNVNYYVQTHGINLTQPNYYLDISCLSDDNNFIDDNIIKLDFIKDIPISDFRLQMIHDELVLQINYLLDTFVNDKTEQNYNNLKNMVFNHLINLINCTTPVTLQLKNNNKQINSLRIAIYDNYYYFVLDTYETAYNTFNNYLNNQIHTDSSHFILPNDMRCVFYGSHSGIKPAYIVQQNVNFHFQSYGINLSEPTYYIGIFCSTDSFTKV
jgi:hypothetical protein